MKTNDRPPIPAGDGTFLVPLTQGQFARIDAESVPLVAPYKWNANKSIIGTFYARCVVGPRNKRRVIFMHRLITDCPARLVVDHQNYDTLDNRRANLVLCSHEENTRRSRRAKNHFPMGVRYRSDSKRKKRWLAQIGGKSLGTFTTQEEAAEAYRIAAARRKP